MGGWQADSGWAAFGLAFLGALEEGWRRRRNDLRARLKERQDSDWHTVDVQTDFIRELRESEKEQRALVDEQARRIDEQSQRIDRMAEAVTRYRNRVDDLLRVIASLVEVLKFHKLPVPEAALQALESAKEASPLKPGSEPL